MKAFIIFGLLLSLGICAKGTEVDSDFENSLQGLIKIVQPHREAVQKWVKSVLTDKELGRAEYLTCDVCTPALALLRPYANIVTEDQLVNLIGLVCEILDLAPSDDICIPTVATYAKPVIYIVKNQYNLTDDDFCGIINPDCNKNVNPEYLEWQIVIDENKPEEQVVPPLQDGLASTTILQFTDIHLDLDYVEGMNADCPLPICCRKANGLATNASMTAGPYGHYKCALPPKALDAMLDDAKERFQNAKYIFLTGDYVHSGVWLYSAKENGRHIANVTARLAAAFPDTKVFPLTGNHEPDICNMYPPTIIQHEPGFSLKWMYNATAWHFTKWMNDTAAVDKFMEAGFYTVSPEPGLRLVVLNTNLCYVQNFWLPYTPIDPEHQLQWFADTMKEAELAQENVYIIAHISPGSGSCWPVWSQQYDRVVNRFAHLIRGQFHGHSHNEYFVLTFDAETKKPITTSYVAPSAVTDSMNSGYKAYHVDGERGLDSTWEVMDHETWILNLTESNAVNSPVWLQEFSAKETYGLESLRPDDYYNLVLSMVENRTMFEKFHQAYRKSSDNYKPCTDAQCISGILCNAMVSNSADLTYCTDIERRVNATFIEPITVTEPNENGSNGILPSFWALVALVFSMLRRF